MFNSNKEVKKMKYTTVNGLILLVSVICGILAFYYLISDNFVLGAGSVAFAVLLERHLEYDIYKKEDN